MLAGKGRSCESAAGGSEALLFAIALGTKRKLAGVDEATGFILVSRAGFISVSHRFPAFSASSSWEIASDRSTRSADTTAM
jgi:hypothetical protein